MSMAICIKCGETGASCLCDRCRAALDVETLCGEILSYIPGSGGNPLWDRFSSTMSRPENFKNIAFALADELASPRREYIKILSITGSAENIFKTGRPWLCEVYEAIKDSPGLTETERKRLHGLALGAYCRDYEYARAEEIAVTLRAAENNPWQACRNLAEFYTQTRRYDRAKEVIEDALRRFADDPEVLKYMQNLAKKNAEQAEKAKAGKPEYMPKPKINKEEAQRKYIEFMASIDMEITSKKARRPTPIAREQYPKPVETRETDFDSFVAFDLETTGTNSKTDSIIEIGAIKVEHGEVIEEAAFTFQELAKPFEHRLSDEIQQLTGITPEELKDAKEMWDVFNDFMDFAGDKVLVGFNCMDFDSRFMVRAGRYANRVIRNPYFDVMSYAVRLKEQLGINGKKVSLAELAERLAIENPKAHRALSDAITTARVFLKLKELDRDEESGSVDDLLAELDSW